MYADPAAASTTPASPIDTAHEELSRTQSELGLLLNQLNTRLDNVLRSEPPAGSASLKAADNPAMSELHGRLLDRGQQAREQCAQVESLLRRLTL